MTQTTQNLIPLSVVTTEASKKVKATSDIFCDYLTTARSSIDLNINGPRLRTDSRTVFSTNFTPSGKELVITRMKIFVADISPDKFSEENLGVTPLTHPIVFSLNDDTFFSFQRNIDLLMLSSECIDGELTGFNENFRTKTYTLDFNKIFGEGKIVVQSKKTLSTKIDQDISGLSGFKIFINGYYQTES